MRGRGRPGGRGLWVLVVGGQVGNWLRLHVRGAGFRVLEVASGNVWVDRWQPRPSETAFCFSFCFSGNVLLCHSVCVFCLCFLSSPTNFSLIPRMRQAQSTPLGLILNHFKDFHRVTEDLGLVVYDVFIKR